MIRLFIENYRYMLLQMEWFDILYSVVWRSIYYRKYINKGICLIVLCYLNKMCFASGQTLLLCVGTVIGTVNVWLVPDDQEEAEVAKLTMLHTLQGHLYSRVTSLAVDRSGLLLASGKLVNWGSAIIHNSAGRHIFR